MVFISEIIKDNFDFTDITWLNLIFRYHMFTAKSENIPKTKLDQLQDPQYPLLTSSDLVDVELSKIPWCTA